MKSDLPVVMTGEWSHQGKIEGSWNEWLGKPRPKPCYKTEHHTPTNVHCRDAHHHHGSCWPETNISQLEMESGPPHRLPVFRKRAWDTMFSRVLHGWHKGKGKVKSVQETGDMATTGSTDLCHSDPQMKCMEIVYMMQKIKGNC